MDDEPYIPESDPTLMWLVDTFEQPGAEINVILTLPGLAVSGRVISGAEFFRGYGELFANATQDLTQRSSWLQMFGNMATSAEVEMLARKQRMSELTSNMPGSERLATLRSLERRHIFLREVVILGAGTAPLTAPFWRGRLSSVVGWHFGQLNPPQPIP